MVYLQNGRCRRPISNDTRYDYSVIISYEFSKHLFSSCFLEEVWCKLTDNVNSNCYFVYFLFHIWFIVAYLFITMKTFVHSSQSWHSDLYSLSTPENWTWVHTKKLLFDPSDDIYLTFWPSEKLQLWSWWRQMLNFTLLHVLFCFKYSKVLTVALMMENRCL